MKMKAMKKIVLLIVMIWLSLSISIYFQTEYYYHSYFCFDFFGIMQNDKKREDINNIPGTRKITAMILLILCQNIYYLKREGKNKKERNVGEFVCSKNPPLTLFKKTKIKFFF
eukprot:c16869_g1_i2.p1 GENE.c16869_g1_i2~~c16869_g1_i2.p1  ORF type:complete len:113 (+),score=0.34 c16869_g1_i2:13-351(+)